MVDKSPDAFRTISEVGEDLDLPQHVLRFWETRFPQIRPLKRGGGRRYYRPDDVALIMGLKTLLYGQGYTIKGVQRILKEQGIKAVQGVGRGAALPPSAKAPPAAAGHGADVLEADEDDDASAESGGTVAAPPASRQSAVEPAAPIPTLALSPAASGDAAKVLRLALTELAAARSDLARVLKRPEQG